MEGQACDTVHRILPQECPATWRFFYGRQHWMCNNSAVKGGEKQPELQNPFALICEEICVISHLVLELLACQLYMHLVRFFSNGNTFTFDCRDASELTMVISYTV